MASLAEAIRVQADDSHTYGGYFHSDWCIGSVPHGGTVSSCIQSAAHHHFSTTLSSRNQPHTLSLHATFLRRTSSGPFNIHISDAKLGARTSTIHFSLAQGPRVCVVGYVTHTNLAAESGISLPTSWTLEPTLPTPDFPRLRHDTDADWKLMQMPFASFRKAMAKVEFYLPRSAPHPSISAVWLRLACPSSRFTDLSLGYVADTFPQVVENYPRDTLTAASGTPRPAFWYPTVLLNLEIKKLAPPDGWEWLLVNARAKVIRNGRMDLELVVCDETGEVVAVAGHVALVVGAERNLAERGQGDSKL